ncbi:membrane bound O-acyl transferase family-domain-containing protein [Stachybotrys elegans]|uniref:Membrane bound O-acyl transferase family-domain-containing protein n=1 Tax=Stachybotrys elegans TaxID=80388 RepID=A0A8K0WN93_9HYPO|nr:membrane bound O-acyl transferase family-domain-containing protein [Stachybotrys elegans]
MACTGAYMLPAIFVETMVEIYPEDVAQSALLMRLSSLTARETVVRLYAVASWIWGSFMLMDGIHTILAVVTVITGLFRPADWPPLFGKPTEACGLRRFWGRFWHRLAVRSYSNYGRLVAQSFGMLQHSHRTPGAGAVIAFTVFLISGLTHQVISWRLGTNDWLDLQWYLLNFAACFAETVIVSAVRSAAKQAGWARELAVIERSWLGWAIGFMWTFSFFFWGVPLWKFPRLHKQVTSFDRWMSIFSKMTIVPPT